MRNHFSPLVKEENGITLIELLIYAILLTVILSGAYTMYEASDAIYVSANTQAEAQGGGRVAHALMTKHLRMTESFAEAGDYSIDIRADINDDSLWDRIQYYVTNEQLYRSINGGQAKCVVAGIRNNAVGIPVFKYYDMNGADLTTDTASRLTKTHQIEINLTIDSEPNRPPDAYTLVSKITLRNN